MINSFCGFLLTFGSDLSFSYRKYFFSSDVKDDPRGTTSVVDTTESPQEKARKAADLVDKIIGEKKDLKVKIYFISSSPGRGIRDVFKVYQGQSQER